MRTLCDAMYAPQGSDMSVSLRFTGVHDEPRRSGFRPSAARYEPRTPLRGVRLRTLRTLLVPGGFPWGESVGRV